MNLMEFTYERRVEELKRHIEAEKALLPEFVDGLSSLYLESEDYTCLTLKKLMGRREKGGPGGLFGQGGTAL